MRRLRFVIPAFFAALAAAMASAETPIVDEPIEDGEALPLENASSEPDWFKRFTLSSAGDLGDPTLEGAPETNVRLQWLNTRRWQFTMDLTTRPEESPLPREEMSAGATFQITPRFSIGGDLSVGAERLNDSDAWNEQEIEAGIRLRSAFRF